VVLVGPRSLCDPRLARRDPRARALLPGEACSRRARDIIFLWIGPDIFSGLELVDDDPLPDAVIHSYLANPDGSRMGARTGTAGRARGCSGPYGADATRYGLLKVTSSQDPRFSFGTIEEGEAGETSSGTRAGSSCSPARGARRAAQARSRSAGSSPGIDATRAELEAILRHSTSRTAVHRSTTLRIDDFCELGISSRIKPRLEEEGLCAQRRSRRSQAAPQASPSS
jgi:hypothetical protein